MTEKELFNDLVRLLQEQDNIKESIKAVCSQGKEAELPVKELKKVAALFVKMNFEEVSGEFEVVRQLYNELAD